MLTKTRLEPIIRETEPSEGELPLTETREQLARLLLWSQEHAWPERTGATDKLTYEAVIKTAIAANSLVVEVSRYTLAEQTGISDSTAKASLKRHTAKGRLARFPREDEARATPYRINLDVLQVDTKHREQSFLSVVFRATLQQPPPDLFCGKVGLSKQALRAYEALDPEEAQTAADLGRKLHRHRSSVGRLLTKLADYGLAVDTGDGWLKLNVDLEKLAEDHGMAGITQRKRAYHESLRPGHREYLKHKTGNGNAEGDSEAVIQSRQEQPLSRARASLPTDGRAALPRRIAEPVQSNHGQRIPRTSMEGTRHASSNAGPEGAARSHIRRGGRKPAVCLGCGQVYEFNEATTLAYAKCFDCSGTFEWVA
jgi:hypothetical protein